MLHSARPYRTQAASFTDGQHHRRNTVANPNDRVLKIKDKLAKQHFTLASTNSRGGPRVYLASAKNVNRKHSASSSLIMKWGARKSVASTYATSVEDVNEVDNRLNDLKVRAMLNTTLFKRDTARPTKGS